MHGMVETTWAICGNGTIGRRPAPLCRNGCPKREKEGGEGNIAWTVPLVLHPPSAGGTGARPALFIVTLFFFLPRHVLRGESRIGLNAVDRHLVDHGSDSDPGDLLLPISGS